MKDGYTGLLASASELTSSGCEEALFYGIRLRIRECLEGNALRLVTPRKRQLFHITFAGTPGQLKQSANAYFTLHSKVLKKV